MHPISRMAERIPPLGRMPGGGLTERKLSMAKKKSMPLEWHFSAGKELKEIRDRLQKIFMDISPNYPKSGRLAAKSLRSIECVDSLRATLDGRLSVEHHSDFNTQVYYPGNKH
jgi:hypothetical protein